MNDLDTQKNIIQHLATQPVNTLKTKSKKPNIMKENLKQALEYASLNKANEMGSVINTILQQKIEAELRDLKVDIAKNTYNFELQDSAIDSGD